MNILNKLTIKNLKLNKKRTIVTIVGIILSVALICAVASMYSSAIASLVKYEKEQQGNFHFAFYDVQAEDVKSFKSNRKIKSIAITKHLGYAVLENSKNNYKPYAHIMGFTPEALNDLSIKLVEGRMPKNDQEILITTHLKTNGRISLSVGETITLDVGRRVDADNYELFQNNPFQGAEALERIVDTTSKTYKIVGIIERPATNIEPYSAPGYTFITYTDNMPKDGKVDIYARYTKEGLENQYEVTAGILGVDHKLFKKINGDVRGYSHDEYEKYLEMMKKAKYEINVNSYLIALETNPIKNNGVSELGVVVLIVCLIIMFTSIFCIKNSFDISITEKTKQYGMLKSVGATKKQIKKNVFYEAFILGMISIPLGILLGIIASYILIIVCNLLLAESFDFGFKLMFNLSYLAVLFSIVLGIITIYLSALKVARRASKVLPIDLIRNSADIKINSKNLKSPKLVKSLFGVGGDISYKNLKRNKKKYRTTIISITVSVLTFIALSSFVDLAFLSVEDELQETKYDISLYTSVYNSDATFYNKALETVFLDGVEEYTIKRQDSLHVKASNYSKEYIKKGKVDVDPDDSAFLNIYAVGDGAYRNYLKKLGLDYEKIKNKAILVDKLKTSVFDEEKNKTVYFTERRFKYKTGDTINGIMHGNGSKLEIEVGAISDEVPFAIDKLAGAMIIVSDEFYNENILNESKDKSILILYKTDNANKLQDDIEQHLKEYNVSISNIYEQAKQERNLLTLVAIFLYGFIIVISLIGVTNIFNTITTNMYLRKQEFAMLKSIGMTDKEFKRMIRLESIFMGSKSLMIGIPIGIILSYAIYYFLTQYSGIEYSFPILAIIISIILVFLLITSLMRYSINKINKQNTIETIRNENI